MICIYSAGFAVLARSSDILFKKSPACASCGELQCNNINQNIRYDFQGNDQVIESTKTNGGEEDCCELCQLIRPCFHWVFNKNQGECTLLRFKNASVHDSNFHSGSLT